MAKVPQALVARKRTANLRMDKSLQETAVWIGAQIG